MWQALIAPVATVVGKALDIVDKYIPDKDQAARLKNAVLMQVNEYLHTEFITLVQAQASIILAEAQGDSWLQRNWRPLLMLTCILIIFNNYVMSPYLAAIFGWKVVLELPSGLWALLNVGVGGYIAGRTVEKIKGATQTLLPFLADKEEKDA